MYLGIQTGVETGSRTFMLANELYEIYWEGTIFFPGVDEGEPTIKELLSNMETKAEEDAFPNYINKLRGNWVLFVHDLMREKWLACTDHSHQSFLFFSKNAVSNSFLRLRADQKDKSDIEEESFLCFLYCGLCYTKPIFYSDIRRLDYHDYLTLNNSDLEVKTKKLPDVFFPSPIKASFVSTLQTLFSSLRAHKLCLDLSGGTDTRALLITLHHLGIEFEIATYGDHDYSEVQIAKKVGKLIGKDLRFSDINLEDMKSEDLKLAWEACDGLDLALDSYMFEVWRSRFGYSLVVSGTGGELYKDGGWYRAALRNSVQRHTHEGLIKMLMNSGEMLWAGLPLQEIEPLLPQHHVHNLKQFLAEISTTLLQEYADYPLLEASDRLFFDYSLNRPFGTGNSVLNRFNPLYEPDAIQVGVNQSVWRRLNHNLYRQECGKLNPEVAAIETDRIGLTLSHKYSDIVREYGKYLKTYLLEKTGHGLPSFKTPNRNSLVTSEYILKHPDLYEGIQHLKDKGFLNDKLEPSSLNARVASRIVALHYLLKS